MVANANATDNLTDQDFDKEVSRKEKAPGSIADLKSVGL
jgi:hypothetical protein